MTWSIVELLERHAADAPRELALEGGGDTLTWAELWSAADAFAAGLAERGLERGGRVAMPASPTVAGVVALLGVLRAGAIVAPLPSGRTARETADALEVLAPDVVLDRAEVDAAPTAAAHRRDDGNPRGVDGPRTAADPEAPQVVVLTSGTTGRPKGVVLSGRAMAASADAWLGVLPPATGWAMPLGLGHVAGLGILWRAVRGRVPVHLVAANDPDALRTLLSADGGPSHVSLVPTQLDRLLDLADAGRAPAGVRAVPLGGGPVPPVLVRRALAAGWPVVPTYGLSEMGSGVTALASAEAAEDPEAAGTAGRPLPGVSLTIEEPDEDGVGEIVVTGAARCSGYLGEPPVASGTPVRTGDLGRIDPRGRLIVVDRRTDRICRGGENIDPGEVEAVLQTHPAVAAAAVVARPDAVLGQVPVAAIVLGDPTGQSAADPGDAALAAHARASLAGFKVPAAFVRLDALPRTASGKLRRDAVRALVAGERTGELARPDGDAVGWRVTGAGPRQIVLLHGTLSTSAQLDRLAAALAAPGDATVHALDRRGSGSSRLADPRPLDVAVHVADLVAYLDARGIARASLVGVSFGGVIALEAAARRPERVDAVVAYEPPYGLVADAPTLAWFERLAADTWAAHADRGRGAAAETFLRAVAGDAAWERLGERARGFLAGEGDGALVDSGLRGLEPAGLGRIVAPVTILTGGASEPFYAPIADALATRIRGSHRVRLDGLAHPAPITDPAPIAAAIRAALELPA